MYDIDWESQEARQALTLATKQRKGSKLDITEFEIAEIIMTAKGSFWYSQAQHDNAPGAKALVELVDGGYHAATKTWWDIKATWPDIDAAAQKLTDLTLYVGARMAVKNTNLMSGSLMWPIVAQIILGNKAGALFVLALLSPEKVKEQWIAMLDGSAFVKPCIHPECDELVDRRKRKSGACCKAHMNYVCHHPDCVAKAEAEGWKHYTHRFGTKIAKAHWGYREGAPPPEEQTEEAPTAPTVASVSEPEPSKTEQPQGGQLALF